MGSIIQYPGLFFTHCVYLTYVVLVGFVVLESLHQGSGLHVDTCPPLIFSAFIEVSCGGWFLGLSVPLSTSLGVGIMFWALFSVRNYEHIFSWITVSVSQLAVSARISWFLFRSCGLGFEISLHDVHRDCLSFSHPYFWWDPGLSSVDDNGYDAQDN